MAARHIGLDFGTTNSSLAVCGGDRKVTVAVFSSSWGATESFRSVLYFPRHAFSERPVRRVFAGPSAIAKYLSEDEPKGRLIQSIKSFAADRTFTSTVIFGRPYTFGKLVSIIIKQLVTEAEQQIGPLGDRLTVGRPVRFAGAESADDEAFGLARLTSALNDCGFQHIDFEYEPVGAAYFYESTLVHEELVLVADFGGGTSDFSIVRVGPGLRDRYGLAQRIVANAGLATAGDAFDAAIIRNLVSPELGAGTDYRSMNKLMPIPAWLYRNLERWHYLSFLKAPDTMHLLRSLKATAVEPRKIGALIHLVDNDLGYRLHQAVQAVKVALSGQDQAQFVFEDGDIQIRRQVKRSAFQHWIAGHLEAIAKTVDDLLMGSGVGAEEINRVFLTGGSAFVPAVREIFAARFGEERLLGGSEFTSVAKGLAFRAAEAQERSSR
jgi:hypothetical chaperone protein